MRTLLTHIKDATSFDDLKTFNGHVCNTFKEACILLDLLENDTEWDTCLHEASQIKTGQQLRHLFAIILLYCQPAAPETLWNNHKLSLCEDILYQHCQFTQDVQYTNINNTIEYRALNQLNQYLLLNGKSLKDFPNMDLLLENMPDVDNDNN